MTNKELQEKLKEFPDNMDVGCTKEEWEEKSAEFYDMICQAIFYTYPEFEDIRDDIADLIDEFVEGKIEDD
ncbi:hypothetical protein OfM1_19040 [Lactovum odontotermitis]